MSHLPPLRSVALCLILAGCAASAPPRAEPVGPEPDAAVPAAVRPPRPDAATSTPQPPADTAPPADAAAERIDAPPPDAQVADVAGDTAIDPDPNAVIAGTYPSTPKGTWNSKCHPAVPMTANGAIVPLRLSEGKLFIGASPAGVQRLPWDVDVVRIYDRSLTLEEIADHHGKKSYAPCTAARGCLAEWDFEEVKDDGFVDTGPNMMATKTGRKDGAAVETVPGVRGKAARFGKIWLEIDHHPALAKLARAFTFEAWVKRSWASCPEDGREGNRVPCEFMRLFDKGSPTFRLDLHAGGFRMGLSATQGSIGVTHGGDVNAYGVDRWVHLVAIFDTTRGAFYFMDGKATYMHKDAAGNQLPGCFP